MDGYTTLAVLLTLILLLLVNARAYRRGLDVGYENGKRVGYLLRKGTEFARMYGMPPEQIQQASVEDLKFRARIAAKFGIGTFTEGSK